MTRLICITVAIIGSIALFGCAEDPFDPGPVDAPSSMNASHTTREKAETATNQ